MNKNSQSSEECLPHSKDRDTIVLQGKKYFRDDLSPRLLDIIQKYETTVGEDATGVQFSPDYREYRDYHDHSDYRDHRDAVKSVISNTLHATLSNPSAHRRLDLISTSEPVVCSDDTTE